MREDSNFGFTMIELLATITIMGIIMTLAIIAIGSIIENSRKKTFENSVGGITRTAIIETESMNTGSGNIYLYKYDNNSWTGYSLDIDGNVPKYIELEVNDKNEVRYAITDGRYCVVKNEFSGESVTKKISNGNTDKYVQEKYCVLDAVIASPLECFDYTESDEEIIIIGYFKKEGNTLLGADCPTNVTIPNKINKKKVTTIGEGAFYNYKLNSLVLPNTIKTIEDWAFRNTDLPSLVIPEGVVSLGGESFADNEISSLVLPSTLVNIGAHSFRNNKLPQESAYIYKRNADGSIDYSTIIGYGGASKNISIPREKNGVLLTTLGDSAFYSNGLTGVVIPDTVINIESSVFRKNSFNSIVVPNGVKSLGGEAFADGVLTSLSLPSTLNNIGKHAFRNNSLPPESAFIYRRNGDGSIDYSTIIGYGGASKDVIIPSVKNGVLLKTIGNSTFYFNNLNSVSIPEGVTKIEDYAFYRNKLTEITLPSTLMELGSLAFYQNNISHVTIPSGVKNIYTKTFDVNPLTSVTINSSFSNVNIESRAFGDFNISNIDWVL